MYDETIARTSHGPVRGRIRDGVHAFRGIRYGQDTAGYRFGEPREPEPWTDTVNAFEYGPSCPQDDPVEQVDRAQNPFLQKIGLTDNLPESEDCLFLNAWTPGVRDGARRPVMVWVHSGGFWSNSGSSPAIDGARLAAEGDVVVVTFNHRLNVLGYTHLTGDPASPLASAGNVGMLDVVAVLRWVRRNAAELGGDPDNVTLFGQSGGAMKISTLLAMPSAAGLFHRAILQSGALTRISTVDQATAVTARLLGTLGLEPGDAEALTRVPLPELMSAYRSVFDEVGLPAFGAVVDGVVVPAQPFDPVAPDVSADVPLIVGDLDTEMALFLRDRAERVAAWDDERVAQALGEALGTPDGAREVVRAVRAEHPQAGTYELLVRILSAGMFTVDAVRLLERKAQQGCAPAWRYRITWRTPVEDGVFMSPHEVDVALVFGNVEAAAGLNGGGAEAQRLSELLRASWLAFARTGSPVNPHVPDWPPYETATRRALVLDPEPSVRADVDAAEIAAVLPYVDAGVQWFRVVG
jgi:para-nitrobenzyl esterase